ncbi:MAG: DUF2281 domain-containing protein [Dehalococcoidia bacterium]|nr:DUF2281 domain-containing protein [Dehalococcoidia bacterium]
MEIKEIIFKEIERLPEQRLQEVLDFIHLLEGKALEERVGTAVASESSLGKDWLSVEEDESWRDL